MTQFILDMGSPQGAATYAALDLFTRGYIEAAFFTETGDGDDAERDLEHASVAELAPDALARAVRDCAAFQAEAAKPLWSAYNLRNYEPEQAGRDFWLTRNGHGAGFWDRPELESFGAEIGSIGETLSAHARRAGSCDLYRGDDGQIYFA